MIIVHCAQENQMEFVSDVTQALGCEALHVSIEHFADGETYVRPFEHEKVKNRHVILIYQFTCFDTFKSNSQAFDMLYLANLLKESGAAKQSAILPYLLYSRQDEHEIPGTLGGLNFFGSLCKSCGISNIISADIHSPKTKDLLPIPFHPIGLEEFWADFLQQNIIKGSPESVCLASPDFGGRERVETIAQHLGTSTAYMKKTRIGADQPVVLDLHGDVNGKKVIIIDDIIDTGRTACNGCEILLERGATEVCGCFSHAIPSQDTLKRLDESSFKKIYTTNTITCSSSSLSKKLEQISASKFLGEKIRKIIS